MAASTPTAEQLLERAVALVNQGHAATALAMCEQWQTSHGAHPAILQLLSVLSLRAGNAHEAWRLADASLALRPDHLHTLAIAADSARAAGRLADAAQALERTVSLSPQTVEAWFQLALVRHDQGSLAAASAALQEVLRLAPERADAAVNLGIVLQDSGSLDEAMRAYGRAYRLDQQTFGRIAHSLANSGVGRLWLDLGALRHALAEEPT